MKKFFLTFVTASLSLLLLAGCGSGEAKDENSSSAGISEPVDIGIIKFIEHQAMDEASNGFLQALNEAGYVDGQNMKVEILNAQGDQSNLKTISQKFVSDKKDLILAVATPSAQSIATETSEIPILVTAVTDPYESGLVQSNELPNCNVSGTSDLTPIKEQMDLLVKLLPDAKKVTILYCSGEQNSLIQANIAEEAGKALGLEIQKKTVSNSNDVAQVTQSIIGNSDAIYIPTDNVMASSMPLVASITNPAGMPVIVGEMGLVNNGGLASVAIDYTSLGKQTGEMAVEIIKGADIKSMPIQYMKNPQLVINEDVAAELGINVPEDIKANAKIVKTNNN